MDSSVLVTGGAGFIGSSLVRKLLQKGYQVLVLDNLINGKRESLPDNRNLRLLEGDITNPRDIMKCMDLQPEYVVHLAAHHFIPYCNLHPAETVRVNIYGTQNLLECILKANGVKKIINASTAAVYAPSENKCGEKDRVDPIDIYGISKKSGEDIIKLFNRVTGIPCVNARIFNAIGPRETNPHLLPDIIKELQEGKIEIHLGNIVSKRDYIYVDDISNGIITLLESEIKKGQFNIGSGSAFSAKDIVEIIGTVMGKQYKILSVADKQRKDDRPFLLSDNKSLTGLGWKCEHTIREGIEKTLSYYNLV